MKQDEFDRYREIIRVIRKNKFLRYLKKSLKMRDNLEIQRKFARSLRNSLEDLGPTFVKLGQMLSTRMDIFPKEIIKELNNLQENVRPISMDEIDNILRNEYGDDLPFKYFNKDFFATGSIAQVHSAILNDGREVLLKIQRPSIERVIDLDLIILKRIFKFLSRTKIGGIIDLNLVLEEFTIQIKNELDFNKEMSNLEKFYKNNKDDKLVRVPLLYREYSSRNIIVMELIKADTLRKVIDSGNIKSKNIGKTLLYSYANQVFKDGFFHGDPHPGNIMLEEDGKIVFIDFGIVGSLPLKMKYGLLKIFYGISKNNTRLIIDGLIDIDVISPNENIGMLERDLRKYLDKYLYYSLKEIKIKEVMDNLFDLFRKYTIKIPSNIVLLSKTFIMLESLIEQIDLDENILELIVPIASKLKYKFVSLDYFSLYILPSLYDSYLMLESLPSFLLDAMRKFKDNGNSFNINLAEDEKSFRLKKIREKKSIAMGIMFSSLFFFIFSFLSIFVFQVVNIGFFTILAVISFVFLILSFFYLIYLFFKLKE